MGIDTVRRILNERLDSIWLDQTPIYWDNIKFYPKVGISFLRCSLDGVFSELITMKCQREFYTFTVQVITSSDRGSSENLLLTEQLMGGFFNFRQDKLFVERAYSERGGEDKNWYIRNTVIEVAYDATY